MQAIFLLRASPEDGSEARAAVHGQCPSAARGAESPNAWLLSDLICMLRYERVTHMAGRTAAACMYSCTVVYMRVH